MNCAICEAAFSEKDGTEKEYMVFEWPICHLCIRHIKQFCKQIILGNRDRILWGMWAIYRNDWKIIKKFLSEHKIETVLEYGVGLSTELMVLDGYHVTCLEPIEWFGKRARRCVHKRVIIYDRGRDLKGVHATKLKMRFDFGFVDAPAKNRTQEMLHATKIVDRYIYMHNPCEKQIQVLEDAKWTPMEDWGKKGRFFVFYQAPEGE